MRGALALALVLAGLMIAGCGRSDGRTGELEQKAKNHEQRLAELEKGNQEFKAEAERLRGRYAELKRQADALSRANADIKQEVTQIVSEAIAEEATLREIGRAEQREEVRRRMEEQRARWRERQLDELGEALKLNDEQEEQVRDARAQMQDAMRDTFAKMRREGTFNREAMRETMARIRAEHDKAMKKILSGEQFEQYQKLPARDRGFGF